MSGIELNHDFQMLQISEILMDGKSYFLPSAVNQCDKEWQGLKIEENVNVILAS